MRVLPSNYNNIVLLLVCACGSAEIILQGTLSGGNSPNLLIFIWSKDYVKNDLFLKSYGPMASFHKVIKLLKFKSPANLLCFEWKAQSRERILLRNLIRSPSLDCAFHSKQSKFSGGLNFKSFIAL